MNGLWDEAVAAAAKQPTPITASFIASLNETIDLEATRVAEKRNRVPNAVWLLLLSVAGCGLWSDWLGGGNGRTSSVSCAIRISASNRCGHYADHRPSTTRGAA
jgi:hypothetical protein